MMKNSTLPLKKDDSGVTPVIGIMLMVAITVILAAFVGLLYFSTDTKYLQKPPQAAFEATTVAGVNADTGKLTVSVIKLHKSGEILYHRNTMRGYIVELNGLKSIFSTQMVKDTK